MKRNLRQKAAERTRNKMVKGNSISRCAKGKKTGNEETLMTRKRERSETE